MFPETLLTEGNSIQSLVASLILVGVEIHDAELLNSCFPKDLADCYILIGTLQM
jgi:hypothetical protein